MTNAELIDGLRCCAESTNVVETCAVEDCPYHPHSWSCIDDMLRDAAAALEAAEQRIAELEKQEPTEKQVVDYCHKRCLVIVEEELFQRMKATFSQLPKEGEWLRTDAFPHRIYCSVCYKTYVPNDRWQIWVDDELPKNYCPNCGARMRDHLANVGNMVNKNHSEIPNS